MTVYASKPEINVREKLKELDYGHVPYEKMPAGSVIQVVNVGYPTGTFAISSGSNNLFSATIFPKFNNSKILISGQIASERITADLGSYYYANLGRSIASGSNTFLTRIADATGYQTPQYSRQHGSNTFLDSPNTTSEIEYIISIDFYGSGTHNIKISTLTLMEVKQ